MDEAFRKVNDPNLIEQYQPKLEAVRACVFKLEACMAAAKADRMALELLAVESGLIQETGKIRTKQLSKKKNRKVGRKESKRCSIGIESTITTSNTSKQPQLQQSQQWWRF
jgi:hypothetical protein